MKTRQWLACLLALCLLPAMALPAAAAQDGSATTIPILMYHHIAPMEQYNSMTVSPQRFEADMAFLRDNGFTPLLPADVLAIAAGDMAMPQRPVMITFDDGYMSNYVYMYPTLQATGMKATVNLIAMLVRNGDAGAAWTLSWDQCREMYQSGLVDFGSHTWNLHNPNSALQYRPGGVNGIMREKGESREDYNVRVGEDLARSVQAIEEKVGNTVAFFAYPFGCTDSWAFSLLESSGIALAVTTGPGLADINDNLLCLPRYRVDMNTPLEDMAAIKALLRGQMPPQGEAALTGEPASPMPYSLEPLRRALAALEELARRTREAIQ